MKRNDYYCYVDEKKMTEAEWNAQHTKEVENDMCDYYGYWHCDTYELYSKAFDKCMASQIKNRDSLRNWYVELMKAPFNDAWAHALSDFSDSFKGCYGYRPTFFDAMLSKKGVTWDDVHKAWDREED